MNKSAIAIIAILLLLTGCSQQAGKCGDGICDDFEKANPDVCPADCNVSCPKIAQPAPNVVNECKAKNGTIQPVYGQNNCIIKYACSAQAANRTAAECGNAFGTFFVVHLEVGNYPNHKGKPFFNNGNTSQYNWQSVFWPTLVEMIKLADEYDAKLTLLLNPQWVEFIASDEEKLQTVRKWVANGHEIGLHHHGADHIDWNGFTDRMDKKNDWKYRGTMKDMKNILSKLGIQMTTATISDKKQDYAALQDVFIYDVDGHSSEEGRRPPYKVDQLCPGLEFTQLGMSFLPDVDQLLAENKESFKKATEKDIYGLVTHEIDFQKSMISRGRVSNTVYKEWFDFVTGCGYKVRTIRDLMDEYRKTYPIDSTSNPILHTSDYPNDASANVCAER